VPVYAWAPWQSGRYYCVPNSGSVTTTASLSTAVVRATPFVVPNDVTLVRIGGEVTGAGDAGSVLRLGIYGDDGTGRPGPLIIDAGTIAGDSATVQEITISAALKAGVYYSAAAQQVVTVTPPTVRAITLLGAMGLDAGVSLPGAGSAPLGYTMTSISGAFPASFTVAGLSGVNHLRIFVKVG